MDKLVTIATFDFPAEAQTIKLLLEEQGIEVFLADDSLVGMNWFLANAVGGAKLRVLESYAERARQFVEEYRQTSRQSHEFELPAVDFDCEECGHALTFPGQRRGGVETCPHCNQYVDVPE
ncbi:MAG: DUF2007 domain-containing protein [Planctomycetes bacterium]|nr:DUF2007 domain-containing protein [Planctomycetota bacterium]